MILNNTCLYSDLILDQASNPRNWGRPQIFSEAIKLKNTACGDNLQLYLSLEELVAVSRVACIKVLSFTGQTCALSPASASLMCALLEKENKQIALKNINQFLFWMNNQQTDLPSELTKLSCFRVTQKFPNRKDCVTMAWLGLQKSLSG